MLLSEAIDPGQLATKQSVIDRLKADLTAAGIRHKDRGSTSIDIFNNVTVAHPIYSAVATADGFLKLIDDSARRTSLIFQPCRSKTMRLGCRPKRKKARLKPRFFCVTSP